MIGFSSSNVSPVAVAGLMWDFFGAFFLAKALIFNKDQSIRRQAGTYWNVSVPLLRSLCEQRIDARFGISMLMTGFALQFVASCGLSASWPVDALLVLPIALLYFTYERNFDRWVMDKTLRINGTLGATRDVWRGQFFPDISPQTFNEVFDLHESRTVPNMP